MEKFKPYVLPSILIPLALTAFIASSVSFESVSQILSNISHGLYLIGQWLLTAIAFPLYYLSLVATTIYGSPGLGATTVQAIALPALLVGVDRLLMSLSTKLGEEKYTRMNKVFVTLSLSAIVLFIIARVTNSFTYLNNPVNQSPRFEPSGWVELTISTYIGAFFILIIAAALIQTYDNNFRMSQKEDEEYL